MMFTNKVAAKNKISSKTSNSNSKISQSKVLPSIVKPFQLKSIKESSQGKFESANQPTQLMEEEQPLQGKFETVQLKKYLNLKNQIIPKDKENEEEALQGKFESANQPTQLMEEEEPLQGKFLTGERKSSPNWAFNLNSTNSNTNNLSANLE